MLNLWDRQLEDLHQRRELIRDAVLQRALPYEEYLQKVGEHAALSNLISMTQHYKEQFLKLVDS